MVTKEMVKLLKKADSIIVRLDFDAKEAGITLTKKVKSEFGEIEARQNFNSFPCSYTTFFRGNRENPKTGFFSHTLYSYNGENASSIGALALLLREGDELCFECFDNTSTNMEENNFHDDCLVAHIRRNDKPFLLGFEVLHNVCKTGYSRSFQW